MYSKYHQFKRWIHLALGMGTSGVVAGRALLPMRLMLGTVWLMGGVMNLNDAFFACGFECGSQRYEGLIGIVWATGVSVGLPVSPTIYLSDTIPANPVPGMSYLLAHVIAPNAGPFMITTATLEVLLGISILVGAFTRISLLGGIAMNVLILLAAGHTHPGILRTNLLMAAAAASLYLSRSGGYLGLDAILSRKLKAVPLLRRLTWS
ncbi:MAG: TQO small subunit DoxD [Thermoplasmata archaeon]